MVIIEPLITELSRKRNKMRLKCCINICVNCLKRGREVSGSRNIPVFLFLVISQASSSMISSQVTSPGKHIKDSSNGFVPPGRLHPRGHSPFLTGGAGPEPQSWTDSHSLRPSLGRHPRDGGHLGSSSHPTSPRVRILCARCTATDLQGKLTTISCTVFTVPERNPLNAIQCHGALHYISWKQHPWGTQQDLLESKPIAGFLLLSCIGPGKSE